MTLGAEEFLRRFLLHVLPKGLVRIRFFGFLANRRRGTQLILCQQLLASSLPIPPDTAQDRSAQCQWPCPLCGGAMTLVERLGAHQLPANLPAHADTS
jgi:hypothetical protein